MDGPRRSRVRRDDERPRRAPNRAGGGRALLDARARAPGGGARRHREGVVRDVGRQAGRGRSDAIPGRPPLHLRLVAVGLPVDVHLLCDRPDALRAQPDRLGDPRSGAPLPPDRAGRPLRVHGHGRADAQPRRRVGGRPPASRSRHHASAHDHLDGGLAAGAAPFRRRGGRADPVGALAPRRRSRASLAAHAGERPLPARRRDRRVPPIRLAASPQGVRRVRDAGRRERRPGTGGAARGIARPEGVQGEPDSVQPDRRVRRLVAARRSRRSRQRSTGRACRRRCV